MKKQQLLQNPSSWVLGCCLIAGVFYFLAPGWETLFEENSTIWQWRRQIILLTGLICWTLMTLCMVIALRPRWIEKWTHGLDKAYHIHKWAGIAAFTVLATHWLLHDGMRWLVSWGMLDAPLRPATQGSATPLWQTLGKDTGLWALYLFVVAVGIAVLHKIPYKFFQKSHLLFPIIYIIGAYHSIVMMPSSWWQSPSAYYVVLISAAGVYAAIASLSRTVGKSRQFKGIVEQVQQKMPGLFHLQIQLKENRSFAHQPGQFAFINFGHHEGHHPFTIAGANTQKLDFVIKSLGDFTQKFEKAVTSGQQVTVEGPYGCFDFQSPQPSQVWVAGGIGITPFLARLEHLARTPHTNQSIHFWYCVQTEQESLFPENLDQLCEAANVSLHRMVAAHQQVLTPEIIAQHMHSLNHCSVWFCGPAGFAQSLRHGLQKYGLAQQDFHAERFNMR